MLLNSPNTFSLLFVYFVVVRECQQVKDNFASEPWVTSQQGCILSGMHEATKQA